MGFDPADQTASLFECLDGGGVGPGEVDQAVAEGVVAVWFAQAAVGGRHPAGGAAQRELPGRLSERRW
ncbi:hypothetical protein ACIRYZ_46075 [Kitasatospora sp. NPDC101155]|uniref:hypothetical protein n=1 Tax=Kitasatospora sp. NPDC101155 TaxID=3364097 RepID=UPI0038168872